MKKRKLERDFEEVEDFFRKREQNRQAELAAERTRAAQLQAQRRRREWQGERVDYALKSVRWGTPKEIELPVHEAVEGALSELEPTQPKHLVRRLVDAAVEQGLAPWRQAESRRKALEAGIDRLPLDVKFTQDFADLKQRALRLAAETLDTLKPGATDWEMQESAKQAVQPVIQEYERREACKRIIGLISLPGATSEELEDAKEATREALAELPIGASQRQLEKARDTALAPLQRTIAEREQRRQQQKEQEFRELGAELQAVLYLNHIKTYLENEVEFDGDCWELSTEADRLREPIRKRLIEDMIENPDMTPDEINELVEELVDELLDD